MTTSSIRVRFAPSPTGHLHIGGLRAALFNWLFARHHNGTFLLRIEDTDVERSKKEYEDAIFDALRWVDIQPDEPTVIQSSRLAEHKKVIAQLLAQGKVYKCYCSEDDLKKRHPEEAFLKYDRHCLSAKPSNPDAPHAIRFKVPDIQEIVFNDLIRGHVAFGIDQLDDFIIARSDGTPMYNFVVVVDDAFSRITHIIRGEEHLSNTPKQILLYQACGYSMPQFAHIPLILGPSGEKLSKRDGATSVIDYKTNGYLPAALINYLVRLGWAHGDQEVFTREELISFFSLDAVGKKGAIFDVEKLNWLNGVYIRQMSNDAVLAYIVDTMRVDVRKQLASWNDEKIKEAISLYKDRVHTLAALLHDITVLYQGPAEYHELDMQKWVHADTRMYLEKIQSTLAKSDWNKEAISVSLKDLAKELGVKLVLLAQPIRLSLIGTSDGPGVFDMLVALGKESSIARMRTFGQTLTV